MLSIPVITQAGNLTNDLRAHLAQAGDFPKASEIPLQLCFQRQGIGFRSAIALKLAAHTHQSPQAIAQAYLTRLTAPTPQPDPKHQTATTAFTYEAIATPQGWLEFFLVPTEIGRWLDRLLLRPENLTAPKLSPDLLFSCHYLQQRFQDLSNLAADYAPDTLQWNFENAILPTWEQALLEAIAHCALGSFENRPKPHLFAVLEQNLWEVQRHCPLFYFLRENPTQGRHYWQWFTYLAQFLACYLPQLEN
ncbi:hypothetical protein AWQ21_07400 [Picosynechococcus sp. PCC 7003]|uniref:hypothetical protein n=1 Tax=Picosynechococcus sp. PCC 7003 TaxID=374981 RepID=UPI000810EE3E|nr:hypothetical protein [Picosynechococcus sp. PCC 7003]ANV84220.1 hypothetical protein AWQ21_07400 [Picosynechococcus sp. PCC 7003]